MSPARKLRWIVVLPVLAILVVASLATLFPIKSGPTVVKARFSPPSQWRVGFHRVNVCESLTPMMVGWNLNLGPLSVSRLEPWQFSTAGNTNVIILQATNAATQTETVLK